jgi:hypothetical protein
MGDDLRLGLIWLRGMNEKNGGHSCRHRRHTRRLSDCGDHGERSAASAIVVGFIRP